MATVGDFRRSELAAGIVRSIGQHATREARFMEFCGGHTVAILKNGIRQLLPPTMPIWIKPSPWLGYPI